MEILTSGVPATVGQVQPAQIFEAAGRHYVKVLRSGNILNLVDPKTSAGLHLETGDLCVFGEHDRCMLYPDALLLPYGNPARLSRPST